MKYSVLLAGLIIATDDVMFKLPFLIFS